MSIQKLPSGAFLSDHLMPEHIRTEMERMSKEGKDGEAIAFAVRMKYGYSVRFVPIKIESFETATPVYNNVVEGSIVKDASELEIIRNKILDLGRVTSDDIGELRDRQ